MITLEEYYENLIQDVLSTSEGLGEMKSTSFFQIICELLIESGDLTTNYCSSFYKKTGLEIAGWDFDEERETLNLIIYEYTGKDEIQKLTSELIESKFKRIENFYEKALNKYYLELEETSDEYSAAYHIWKKYNNKEFNLVKFILISDNKNNSKTKGLPSKISNGIELIYQIIDINDIYKISMPNFIKRDTIVSHIIPCLAIHAGEDYESYLAAIDGETLYEIYDKYGKTLLEENVRTFLQFKGKINTGIKKTIIEEPSYFLAYNNGITATASEVRLNRDNNEIIEIVNLQIVNGGQTTSSIYTAKKKFKLDISKVMVQMKLSVVKDKNKYNEFVSNISRFANSQNKVNDSDLFSNHPFHRDFSEFSKNIWAPSKNGFQKRTRWYYEKSRGQYLNEQALLSKADKMKFLADDPKHQKIDKTFLAKSENLWLLEPIEVCKGAQKSFTKFAEFIDKKYEEQEISEEYFKNAISRATIFKQLEKEIAKASWYQNGYRSQTIAYTISYFAYRLHENNWIFNFSKIWDAQGMSRELLEIFLSIAEKVMQHIIEPPKRGENIGEWCKKKECWLNLKNKNLEINLPTEYLIKVGSLEFIKKNNELKLDPIDIIKNKVTIQEWKIINEYLLENGMMTSLLKGLLEKMIRNIGYAPTDNQCVTLYKIYSKVKEIKLL